MQPNIKSKAVFTILLMLGFAKPATSEEIISFFPISPDTSKMTVTVISDDKEPITQVVTDVHLDLIKRDGDISEAISAANDPERKPFYWSFAAQLFVVADGTLHRDGYGICSAWKDDISVCGIECDGGHFLLRRNLSKDPAEVTLILRRLPELIDDDKSASFRIGECGDGSEIRLGTISDKPVEVTFAGWASF